MEATFLIDIKENRKKERAIVYLEGNDLQRAFLELRASQEDV